MLEQEEAQHSGNLFSYDMCENSTCSVVFRNSLASSKTCPVCKTNRFNDNKTPKKRFLYASVADFIRQSFSPHKLKVMREHVEKIIKKSAEIAKSYADISDGEVYKSLIKGDSAEERLKTVPLGLSLDGVSPYDHSTHSMWPVALVNYHLPPEIRFQVSNCWLAMVIPGPKAPNDLAPFLNIVIDELLLLEHLGVATSTGVARARLITVISDLPGTIKAFRLVGVGSLESACPWCQVKGFGLEGKTAYSCGCSEEKTTHFLRHSAQVFFLIIFLLFIFQLSVFFFAI